MKKIIAATTVAIFSLASFITGTYAWFTSQRVATVSTGSFSVVAVTGIEYNLYYLHHFHVDEDTNKDGNYCYASDSFAGYELSNNNPVFNKINFDPDTGAIINAESPTSIDQLWPAHKLTFAIIVTTGDFSEFTLDSWDEETSEDAKVSESVYVSLSWAINIYGAAYYVDNTLDEDEEVDIIANTFSNYDDDLTDDINPLEDCFTYSQAGTNDPESLPITVVDSINGSDTGDKIVVLFFTIEFSNDGDTFYTRGETYYVKDTNGDSNCYRQLTLKDIVFKIS